MIPPQTGLTIPALEGGKRRVLHKISTIRTLGDPSTAGFGIIMNLQARFSPRDTVACVPLSKVVRRHEMDRFTRLSLVNRRRFVH